MVFSRWGRKGYSVFNSLKKTIKIAPVYFTYILLALPEIADAQNDTVFVNNELDLDEVIVTAQKSPVVYSQVARMVHSVDTADIALIPANSVDEILIYSSGIDVRQRGSLGVQSDIGIRGGSFDQVLVMLNGVDVTDPQTGHHNLNLPVDLSSVHKIEILQGPGSRVFGPNAFSGVINIITHEPRADFLKGSFSVGENGFLRGNISNHHKFGKVSSYVNFGVDKSDGYAYNTDFSRLNLFYHAQYNSNLSQVSFQIGYQDKDFGANSFYTPAFPDQFESIQTAFSSLSYDYENDKIKISPNIYWRRLNDQFELFRYEPAGWYQGHNYHQTDIVGGKLNVLVKTSTGNLTFGTEYRNESILSNVLGNPMDDSIQVKGENAYYDHDFSRSINNYFLEYTMVFDQLFISTGLLIYQDDEVNFNVNIYPGLDLSYQLWHFMKIYSTLNKSLRKPTFTDLFYSGPSNIGNPDLMPEETWSSEAGMTLNFWNSSYNISYFYRRSNNLISWVKPDDALPEDSWTTENLTSVDLSGLNFKFTFLNRKLGDVYKMIESLSLEYTWLNQQIDDNDYMSKYSTTYLKHKLVSKIQGNLFKSVSYGLYFRYVDRSGGYDQYNFKTNQYENFVEYKPYFLVDLRFLWRYKKQQFFVEAKNLFDSDYVDFGNIQVPGRWIKCGIKINIFY